MLNLSIKKPLLLGSGSKYHFLKNYPEHTASKTASITVPGIISFDIGENISSEEVTFPDLL